MLCDLGKDEHLPDSLIIASLNPINASTSTANMRLILYLFCLSLLAWLTLCNPISIVRRTDEKMTVPSVGDFKEALKDK
ncbi:hypothetical protein BDZ85DRAFT_68924 [Elsinoe ampelina]|uniref:Uncharacterized protein n=1 Tax=Elsinoe ampelina TaxID=302913 RepID=A0A6A6GIT7_9PEZI|nr:hypothetical protein BDZ85DRAFT_68924 [Elsinoe ampelina]